MGTASDEPTPIALVTGVVDPAGPQQLSQWQTRAILAVPQQTQPVEFPCGVDRSHLAGRVGAGESLQGGIDLGDVGGPCAMHTRLRCRIGARSGERPGHP
jgi:hypothetical protein